MKTVDLNNLKTINNYAKREGVTSSYIYKRIKEKKMEVVIIDGVKFIDVSIHPTIHSK